MHRTAPRRRSAPIAGLEVDLLWHRVAVTGDESTIDRLRALVPDVVHPIESVASMGYRVDALDAGHAVFEEGDRLTLAPDVESAADAVYIRMYRRAFEFASLSGWIRVHAVTADVDGRRILLVGPSGIGKTTLALALCAAGGQVQGDESVLIRDGASLAVPRGFHVKHGAVGMVPQFADEIARSLQIGEVSVVDPHLVSDDWRLRIAPVDEIVLLADAGDDTVDVRECARQEVLQPLIRESFVLTESKADLVAALASVTSGARCRTITRGPLEQMLAALVDEPG